MMNTIKIPVRVFPVIIRDERTGEKTQDHLVLTKEQLRAAQTVGQSSKELVHRMYNREGYHVAEIGKPFKREVTVYLSAVCNAVEVVGEVRVDKQGCDCIG